jgi:hypothetical protein
MSDFDFDDVIRTAKVIVNPEQAASSILALTKQVGELAAQLDIKQTLLDEAIRKGLQLCEQNGTLLMEAHDMREKFAAKDALLLEIFQALAGVLGDMEHRGAVRPIVHKACENAVSHWLEMTQPETRKE